MTPKRDVSGSTGVMPAVRAERVRARGGAAARAAWIGVGISALQGLGWVFVATGPMPDWAGLSGWQTRYATGLLAPVVTLLAATTVSRERAAREGGTRTRPLTPATATVARLFVLAVHAVALSAVLSLPVLLIGVAGGLSDPPVARVVAMWLVLWGTSLLPLAVGAVWNADYVAGFTTWLLVPLGSCVLACVAETAAVPGRRVAALRRTSGQLARASTGLGLVLLAGVVAASTVVIVAAGPTAPQADDLLRYGVLQFVVGAMVLTVSGWLAARFGTGTAVGIVLVTLIVSGGCGGGFSADLPPWVVGVFGWPLRTITLPRVALALLVSTAIAVVAHGAHARAIARTTR